MCAPDRLLIKATILTYLLNYPQLYASLRVTSSRISTTMFDVKVVMAVQPSRVQTPLRRIDRIVVGRVRSGENLGVYLPQVDTVQLNTEDVVSRFI